jgi:hypothetical protein
MQDNTSYDAVCVHPGSLSVYRSTLTSRSRYRVPENDSEGTPEQSVNKVVNFRDNKHHGKLSKHARKKLIRSLDYLGFICTRSRTAHTKSGHTVRYQLVTFTLTLSAPQIHSDREIHSQLCRPFMDQLRRRWHVEHYVWIPEKQLNGRTHFHFLADRWIDKNELRDVWNNIQEKLGYVKRFRLQQQAFFKAGFRFRPAIPNNPTYAGQVKSYREGIQTNWQNPPSTRIDRVYSVKQSIRYMSSYMSKREQKFEIDGRLWGCSVTLSQLTGGRAWAYGRVGDEINRLYDDPQVQVYKSEHYVNFTFDYSVLSSGNYPELNELIQTYVRERFPGFIDKSLF